MYNYSINNMRRSLFKKLKTISKKPGVYLFKDSKGRILYIGKAVNIKKRVQSHFSKKSAFFGVPFIDKVTDIDWIKTKNETEAMLLEDQLIKKYKPRYNIQWKDDKSYFYVTFTKEEWPRVLITHQNKIGKKFPISNFQFPIVKPFVSGRELRKVLRALRKIFPYRTCKNPYEKPCLQWHLGLCPAHGHESGSMNHESRIRKYGISLNALSQFLRLYAGEPMRIEAYDISNIQGNYATGSMIVFYGNKPSKKDYRKFRIKTIQGANDVAMLKEVLRRRLQHHEWPYPDLILIDGGKAQLSAARFQVSGFKLQVPIIALAKREEEIYTEYSNKPLKISRLPQSLRLTFKQIRDEAHRFAIFYYRYLHGKQELNGRRNIRKTNRKTH